MNKDCYCEENNWQDICRHNHDTTKRISNGNCGCPCRTKFERKKVMNKCQYCGFVAHVEISIRNEKFVMCKPCWKQKKHHK